MGFSSGRTSISLEELLKKVSEANIAARYLDITEVPCVISSPVRRDIHPSLGIHSPDGKKIAFRGNKDLMDTYYGMIDLDTDKVDFSEGTDQYIKDIEWIDNDTFLSSLKD